jgi:hypothetical protein
MRLEGPYMAHAAIRMDHLPVSCSYHQNMEGFDPFDKFLRRYFNYYFFNKLGKVRK